MDSNKQRVINLLKAKAEQWSEMAKHAKKYDYTGEANEFFLRADAFREAIRIVEGALPDEG